MNLLFSWSGRIGRGKFWFGQVLLIVLPLLLAVVQYFVDPTPFAAMLNPPNADDTVPVGVILGVTLVVMLVVFFVLLSVPFVLFLISLGTAALLVSGQYYDIMLQVMPEQADAINASRLSYGQLMVSGIFSLLWGWALMAVSVKRTHDRGQTWWWLLIGLIPLVGSIWWLVNLGILEGDDGPNKYGSVPYGA